MLVSGDNSDSHFPAVAWVFMFARPPSSSRPTKCFSNTCANLRKLSIGFRQIPDASNPGRLAYLEDSGTGGVPLAEDARMIAACHVLVDAACDSLPGMLLPVLLE